MQKGVRLPAPFHRNTQLNAAQCATARQTLKNALLPLLSLHIGAQRAAIATKSAAHSLYLCSRTYTHSHTPTHTYIERETRRRLQTVRDREIHLIHINKQYYERILGARIVYTFGLAISSPKIRIEWIDFRLARPHTTVTRQTDRLSYIIIIRLTNVKIYVCQSEHRIMAECDRENESWAVYCTHTRTNPHSSI